MSRAARAPWWVLVVTLVVCAVVLAGPLWGSYLGENPLERPPGPDYGTIVRLAVPTIVLALVLLGTMLWAGGRARTQPTAHPGSTEDHD